jgi:hypothetical protein
MTTQTTGTVDLKTLKAQNKALIEQRKALSGQISAKKDADKAEDTANAVALMSDIKSLFDTPVVVGEGDKAQTITLEEALVSGKPSTIMVGDKERAHTLFMDAGRVASLRKLVVRFRKTCANEEIRPKKNPEPAVA